MLNRRDVWLGCSVVVFFAAVIIFASLVLSSLSLDDLSSSGESIGIVEISGVIISPADYVRQLKDFIDDDSIPAIVIRLNTGGGGVAASQEIFETILKARDAGKIVIASMGTAAASGGYYIAAACDTIFANPGTLTGSIGVIINLADFSELLQKIGVDFPVRKSGKFKDIGSASRKMTEEEKALLDSVIMDIHEQFVQAEAEGRNLRIEDVRAIADGRISTGRQARDLGLVDAMGTYQDAIDAAGELTGLGIDPPLKRGKKRLDWQGILMGGAESLLSIGIEQSMPRLMYMME